MILLVRGLIVGTPIVSVDACPRTRPQTIWKQCPRETRSARLLTRATRLLLPMKATFQIVLKRRDLGQLLDGLRIRAEAWGKTADYLEFGFGPDDSFICEECSDTYEARCIARHYETIIAEIEAQAKKQGGRS